MAHWGFQHLQRLDGRTVGPVESTAALELAVVELPLTKDILMQRVKAGTPPTEW